MFNRTGGMDEDERSFCSALIKTLLFVLIKEAVFSDPLCECAVIRLTHFNVHLLSEDDSTETEAQQTARKNFSYIAKS